MMTITNELISRITKKIYLSKIRLLSKHGFFGSLLIGMDFVVVNQEGIITNDTGIATNGKTIYIDPFKVDSLSSYELDVLIMHELMHIVLKHCFRGKGKEKTIYNRACDIVVNSNIKDVLKEKGEIYIGDKPLEHTSPDGKEGLLHSAEEVYDQLIFNYEYADAMNSSSITSGQGGSSKSKQKLDDVQAVDSHELWSMEELDEYQEDLLDERILKAAEIDHMKGCGSVPLGAELYIKNLKHPQIDWREILQSFVQENIVDYSFNPPDKRFSDGDLILPDFNESEAVVKNILFMVDTSGSMSIEEITDCYSEINGAIEQYNGKLQGYLGFFDAKVYDVEPFNYDLDIRKIKPVGGGGTDFKEIFKYIEKNMMDDPPASIIILTDGYADFPEEDEALGIPVLWVINNEEINPPFGKVARINVNKE